MENTTEYVLTAEELLQMVANDPSLKPAFKERFPDLFPQPYSFKGYDFHKGQKHHQSGPVRVGVGCPEYNPYEYLYISKDGYDIRVDDKEWGIYIICVPKVK